MNNVFHEGELAVQQQAGVQHMAARVGQIIRPFIAESAYNFLTEQPFVIVASVDVEAKLWASVLVGRPPFLKPLDEHTLQIKAFPTATDPLSANLNTGSRVGLLVIEFETRRRMRINGRVEMREGGFLIHTEQVYGNCPKYIQARRIAGQRDMSMAPQTVTTKRLSTAQAQWIHEADTFFIASAHPEGGADASHRGGNSGFVVVEDDTRLVWPDYAGNTMFNTLGNIAANPNTGLLFWDFERNRTLQLTGRAQIVWDAARIGQYAGAERLVELEIEQVIETQNGLPFVWTGPSYSSYNPG